VAGLQTQSAVAATLGPLVPFFIPPVPACLPTHEVGQKIKSNQIQSNQN